MKFIFALFSLVFFASTLARAEAVPRETATVTFSKGSSTLSNSDIKKLRAVLKSAESEGHIRKAEVATWSDKEFPMRGELSKADRDLADRRLESVKSILDTDVSPTKNITTYNMAETSNWLARAFRSHGADLDSIFARKKLETLSRNDVETMRKNGGPSKTVVVVVDAVQ